MPTVPEMLILLLICAIITGFSEIGRGSRAIGGTLYRWSDRRAKRAAGIAENSGAEPAGKSSEPDPAADQSAKPEEKP